jgi:hypothetical protein
MSANGIAWLATKQDKQEAKLAIAEAKRQGKLVADDGTISGPVDSTKQYYRANNVLEIDDLPTKYVGDTIFDNANTGGLIQGRPWLEGPP